MDIRRQAERVRCAWVTGLYISRDTEVVLTASTDLEIAIAEAPATEKFAPVLVTPDVSTSSSAAVATPRGRSEA